MADGGADDLFADLDRYVSFDQGELRIDKRAEGELDLDERGLLLVPSVFVWPTVSVLMDPAWQPTIVYPARAVGMLWEPPRGQAPEALGELVGSRPADILLALDQARSTAELARRLDVPDSSVSQHLRVLRRSGLVDGHRVGRVVLYMRSPLGDQLAGQSEQGGGS